MCGICGFYGFEDKNLIKRMCRILKHRGPDDEGYFFDKNVNLGVRRLSIIDVRGGHQPIHNEDESIWIVFNGEIYNYLELREYLEKRRHKFYTKSDTEVIVHCYEEFGDDFVKKLRGDFSFAIWDSNKKRLVLARDRLGVTPLYYTIIDNSIIFASEIKAILEYEKVKRELDFEALHQYLTFQYVPCPLTAFKGIKKLHPSHILIWEEGKYNIIKYWDVISKVTDFSEDYYVKNILEILKKSVKIRLMGEVPLGIYLSGGLDSSTITALASEIVKEPVKTFSLGSDNPPDNELGYAKIVSEKFETEHKELMVHADSIIKNIKKIFWHMDEPIGDTALVPEFFLSKLAKNKVKIILSGGGGDELFGGYKNYENVMFFHETKKFIPNFARPIIPKLVKIVTENPTKMEYAKFISSEKDDIIYKGQGYLFYYDKDSLYNNFMKSRTKQMEIKDVIKNYFLKNDFDIFHKLAYIDIKIFVPDNCLNHSDRMGYSHSVEVRSPFLDHHLVEFAFTIPYKYKIKGKNVKYILKKTMKDYLPKPILKRKKWGFPAPPNHWFTAEKGFKEFSQNVLDESEIVKKCFREEKIQDLFRKSHLPKESHQLWGLVALAVWYDNFFGKNPFKNF
jgi:asparagine synthase (glutamine-hydrolysing)